MKINNNYKDELTLNDCEINVNNSGTTVRFILGLIFLNNRKSNITINCNEYMKRRPIKELIDAYRMINNEVEVIYLEENEMLPILIKSKGWR